jgi:hypothetical protein
VSRDEPAQTQSCLKERRPCWGLLRRRESWFLTCRGWLLLVVILTGLVVMPGRKLSSFLSVNAPVQADALVVEGWAPDYALAAAISEFKRNSYTRLYVTGGPLLSGAPLSEYKTYAELGAATLLRLGLSEQAVQAVPAPPMRKDRTFTSAVAFKDWLQQHKTSPKGINVISVGPHARRTRLLFEKALGNEPQVGIISIEDQDYDPRHWWKSSHGVRAVIDESIAYGYARLFFRAST